MKSKSFKITLNPTYTNVNEIDEAINNWFKTNPDYRFVTATQSSIGARSVILTIFYEE